MRYKRDRARTGFTLIEIMVVVATIALLAAIVTPSWLRARKRVQASRVLEDLRLIDHAIDQYAMDAHKRTGTAVDFNDIKDYVKKNGVLYNTGADLFGRAYGPFTIDSVPKIPPGTLAALSDVTDSTFWSPYN
jgi:prepilin-type N-terminal cleavage/methylation domain-containing protein